MTMEEKAANWIRMARVMNEINTAGALHIVVSDGNVEDEHLLWCMRQDDVTPLEHAFATKLLEEFTYGERVAIFELTAGAV